MVRGQYDAAETKYLIGQCDFFIGARMHACIAAVSQSIPAVTLAYSKKAAGVMGLVNAADTVADLRQLDLDECLAKVAAVDADREACRARL